jgi:hypothetical protein
MLFGTDSEAFTPFRAAAFEHQPAVLRAHANQKPVRALTMARIGLKSTDTLCHDIPSE